jgi:hypothetical protein
MRPLPHPKTAQRESDVRHDRRRAVMEVFEREGWGSLELVDEWDGNDLDELRSLLRPSEYQTLLDRLRDFGDGR